MPEAVIDVRIEAINEVDRIFKLIERLKLHKDSEFFDEIKTAWTVKFKGEPSLRHANRIAMFRDALAELLRTEMCVAGGKYGSVLVSFAPVENADDIYLDRSGRLAKHPEPLKQAMRTLGVSEVVFAQLTISA